MRAVVVLMGALAAATLLLGSSRAEAQIYPNPVGNCVLNPTTVNIPINGTTEVLLIWSDTAGAPIGNQPVAVQINGGGATISPGTTVTAPDGTATFKFTAGSTPGVATITANCGSAAAQIASQVQVPVGQPPLPPSTGSGGFASGSEASTLLVVLLLAATLGGAFLARRATR